MHFVEGISLSSALFGLVIHHDRCISPQYTLAVSPICSNTGIVLASFALMMKVSNLPKYTSFFYDLFFTWLTQNPLNVLKWLKLETQSSINCPSKPLIPTRIPCHSASPIHTACFGGATTRNSLDEVMFLGVQELAGKLDIDFF